MSNRTTLPDWNRWALFLDIDGTLLDLAPRPEAVIVPPDLPDRLDSLSRRLGGALALISGRSLDGIDRLFPGCRDAAGTHGAEWRHGDTLTVLARSWHDELIDTIAADVAPPPDILIERKPCSLAFHYRGNTAIEPRVRRLACEVAARLPDPIRILQGHDVIELLPCGIDKGKAIERFMDIPPYAGRLPVFVGDDRTDEDGFDTVNRLGGLSIKVGPRRTMARHRLDSPDEVRHWLGRLDHLIAKMTDLSKTDDLNRPGVPG